MGYCRNVIPLYFFRERWKYGNKSNSELKYLVDSIDGKESIPGEEIYIQNEQPEEGKLWIDTGEISNLGTEVVDSLEGNQTNKAPSVHAVKNAGYITDISGKQDKLTAQTAYSAKGSATKVPQITTNTLGQVTGITEVTITQPTVNNATLTIQKNGTNVATFTSNASSNVTANITVPTITDTYSSTSTNGMSGKAVASAISAIGTVKEVTFTNKTVTSGTTVATISLEAGVWIIVAHAQFQGQNTRWYLAVGNNSCSAYDNNGWVDAVCTAIVSHTATTSYPCQMWNMNQDGTTANHAWSGNIKAVRIK